MRKLGQALGVRRCRSMAMPPPGQRPRWHRRHGRGRRRSARPGRPWKEAMRQQAVSAHESSCGVPGLRAGSSRRRPDPGEAALCGTRGQPAAGGLSHGRRGARLLPPRQHVYGFTLQEVNPGVPATAPGGGPLAPHVPTEVYTNLAEFMGTSPAGTLEAPAPGASTSRATRRTRVGLDLILDACSLSSPRVASAHGDRRMKAIVQERYGSPDDLEVRASSSRRRGKARSWSACARPRSIPTSGMSSPGGRMRCA